MFEKIENYIKKSKFERQSHLSLDEACTEIGGTSREFRGLLAHHLGTEIPRGIDIVLAHACNNGKCSNPRHLYWGTTAENINDSINAGTHNTPSNSWKKLVKEHGEAEASKILSERGRLGGKIGGPKTALKLRISEEELDAWSCAFKNTNLHTHGWISKISQEMNCSHTHVKRIIKKHFPELSFFVRKTSKKDNLGRVNLMGRG